LIHDDVKKVKDEVKISCNWFCCLYAFCKSPPSKANYVNAPQIAN